MDQSTKATLQRYLDSARDALLWKLDGLSEYDLRRPMTPSGTNLLGIVKHLAAVESGYFGATFGRPFPEPIPWSSMDAELNSDMWATADESSSELVALYGRVRAHSDATIDALQADSPGTVPHWSGDRARVTLHFVLVHVTAEVNRHGGQADIVRELIDGAVGLRVDNDNMGLDARDWAQYRDTLEQVARGFL